MTEYPDDIGPRIVSIIEGALAALVEAGCPHRTSRALLVFQSAIRADDLGELKSLHCMLGEEVKQKEDIVDDDGLDDGGSAIIIPIR